MVGEEPIFSSGAVLDVHVIAMPAPADDFTGIGVGAPALAMRQSRLPLLALCCERCVRFRGDRFLHPALWTFRSGISFENMARKRLPKPFWPVWKGMDSQTSVPNKRERRIMKWAETEWCDLGGD
jgi:hypothetical protein